MASEDYSHMSLLDKTNLVLDMLDFDTKQCAVMSIEELKITAPVVVVKIFEKIIGMDLDSHIDENALDSNADVVLRTLQAKYGLNKHITTSLLVQGDNLVLEQIMDILHKLATKHKMKSTMLDTGGSHTLHRSTTKEDEDTKKRVFNISARFNTNFALNLTDNLYQSQYFEEWLSSKDRDELKRLQDLEDEKQRREYEQQLKKKKNQKRYDKKREQREQLQERQRQRERAWDDREQQEYREREQQREREFEDQQKKRERERRQKEVQDQLLRQQQQQQQEQRLQQQLEYERERQLQQHQEELQRTRQRDLQVQRELLLQQQQQQQHHRDRELQQQRDRERQMQRDKELQQLRDRELQLSHERALQLKKDKEMQEQIDSKRRDLQLKLDRERALQLEEEMNQLQIEREVQFRLDRELEAQRALELQQQHAREEQFRRDLEAQQQLDRQKRELELQLERERQQLRERENQLQRDKELERQREVELEQLREREAQQLRERELQHQRDKALQEQLEKKRVELQLQLDREQQQQRERELMQVRNQNTQWELDKELQLLLAREQQLQEDRERQFQLDQDAELKLEADRRRLQSFSSQQQQQSSTTRLGNSLRKVSNNHDVMGERRDRLDEEEEEEEELEGSEDSGKWRGWQDDGVRESPAVQAADTDETSRGLQSSTNRQSAGIYCYDTYSGYRVQPRLLAQLIKQNNNPLAQSLPTSFDSNSRTKNATLSNASLSKTTPGEMLHLDRTLYVGAASHLPCYKDLEPLDLLLTIEHSWKTNNGSSFKTEKEREVSKDHTKVADHVFRCIVHMAHAVIKPYVRFRVLRLNAQRHRKKFDVENKEYSKHLEIQIAFMNKKGEVFPNLLFSRHKSRQWPSMKVLDKRIGAFYSRINIQMHETITLEGGGSGHGNANQVMDQFPPLENENYIKVSKQQSKPEIIDLFDSRYLFDDSHDDDDNA